MEDNLLTDVPDELYQLTNLEQVVLASNEFSEETTMKIRRNFQERLPNVELIMDSTAVMELMKRDFKDLFKSEEN